MKRILILTLAMAIGTGIAVGGKKLGPPARDSFWIDGMPYRTIATPTDLPDHGPTDGLYIIEGLENQLPVGEAKPGDRDYNGGRWDATVLQFTAAGLAVHDPDGDGVNNIPLMSWEMVEQHIGFGHLEVVGPGPRFVCPVIKQK